ncbi:MAG: PD-(D/E)XK nuclease family protein, partial [Chloroflexota bacterium]
MNVKTQTRPVLRRFSRALQTLSQTLNLEPEPLPEEAASFAAPTLAYLEANLFELRPSLQEEGLGNEREPEGKAKSKIPKRRDVANRKSKIEAVTFIEAQNRAEEVRAALRWLKARLVRDQMSAAEVALIARDLTSYRPFIEETAAEFGLPLHLREGLNLAINPAIAALMSLLALPLKDGPTGNWAYRPFLDAWRSPYFENLAPALISRRSVDHLSAAARQGLVLQGLEQWRAALTQLVKQASGQDDAPSPLADEEFVQPGHLSPAEARALQSAFETFVIRLTPLPHATLREYVTYVEDLIGEDPELERRETGEPRRSEKEPNADRSLGIVRRARLVPATAARDIAALRAFKDVLRGLVLASSFFQQNANPEGNSAGTESITYEHFYEELQGAVQGATYYLPPPQPPEAALPVLSVLNARGLSFRAVALLGLSEGEFPRSEREDVLLREEDRVALQQAGLDNLEPHLRGDEITFFYQAVTRAREKLLLCRPYLADDGQQWEPSPYWQQVRRLVAGAPLSHIRPEDPLPLSEVASPQELAQTLAQSGLTGLELTEYWSAPASARLRRCGTVLQARLAAEAKGPFEGDLSLLAERFSATYGPEHVWSSSRLEAYGLCPHHFWLGQDLALESRQPPEEGFDVFILGSMYHEILEEVYRQAGTAADREQLLELLPPIAKAVFDRAPAGYGFRPTPLWDMQRRELEQILAQTLIALAEATAGSTPLAQEQVFGMRDQPPLVLQRDGDEFRVRGFIDRVDQDADGRL